MNKIDLPMMLRMTLEYQFTEETSVSVCTSAQHKYQFGKKKKKKKKEDRENINSNNFIQNDWKFNSKIHT